MFIISDKEGKKNAFLNLEKMYTNQNVKMLSMHYMNNHRN